MLCGPLQTTARQRGEATIFAKPNPLHGYDASGPGLKRHPILEPFSRDHHAALSIALKLKENPSPDSVAELLVLWQNEMSDHFSEEERLLAPLAPSEMAARLKREHDEIRASIETAASADFNETDARNLGNKIYDHVRWEERELFAVVQTNSLISTIAEASAAMETRRQASPSAGRRAELVTRRNKSLDRA